MTAEGIIFLIFTFVVVLLVIAKEWNVLYFILFYLVCSVFVFIYLEVTDYYKQPPKDLNITKTETGFLYSSSEYKCYGNDEYYTVLMKDSLSKPTRRDRCTWCNEVFRMHYAVYTEEELEMKNKLKDACLDYSPY